MLIAHDWIMGWAGSERTVAQMLDVLPDAELVVGLFGSGMATLNAVTRAARETWLARVPGARRFYQWLLPLEAAAFRTIDTAAYDLVISSSHALSKFVRPGRRHLHLCYCHSPPRYLWDLHDVYMARATWARRAAMAIGRGPMQALDRRGARGVTHFVANSSYVAARIRRCYGREARVVFPPVEPKPMAPTVAREDFVLYLGRLVPYKRVDVIVRAAAVHGRPTVIAGSGPEEQRLRALAGPNVQFTGAVDEAEAGRLLQRCGVFVFCAEEDFGIAPLEAQAAGAPVAALRAGGAIETMPPGTAVLFDEPEPGAVAAAVEEALASRWDSAALATNARRFGAERFRREFAATVQAMLRGEQW